MPLSRTCQWQADWNSAPLNVGLDDLDLERQALDDVVEELDGGGLVQRRVDPQHPQPGAVVDRGELEVLVAPAAASLWHRGEGLDELDVDLDAVAGQLLLVALPAAIVALLVALGGRQAAHVQAVEDAPDAGLADGDVVVPLEVHGDLLGPEVVVLPQVNDLPHHLDVGRVRAGLRSLGTRAQALDPLGLVAAVPAVVGLPADPEIPAGHRYVPGDLFDVTYDRQAPLRLTVQRRGDVGFRHVDLRSDQRPRCQR